MLEASYDEERSEPEQIPRGKVRDTPWRVRMRPEPFS